MYRLYITTAVLALIAAHPSAAEDAADGRALPPLGTETTPEPASDAPAELISGIVPETRAAAPATRELGAPARAEHGAAAPASDAAATALAAEPAAPKTVEIEDLGLQNICEQITRPGSRIVVAKRCYTRNPNDRSLIAQRARQEDRKNQQIDELRREQENLERMQRQRELEMQRAIMRQGMR